MANQPQVFVTLSPAGRLQAELPGANGSRRKIELARGHAEEDLLRMLEAQLESHISIGEDGAPTEQQVKHWEKHQIFADPRCPHCIAEGRTRPAGRPKSHPLILSNNGGVVIRRVKAKQKGVKPQKAISSIVKGMSVKERMTLLKELEGR